MAMLTIRGLDDAVKQRLRIRAANHGHSMEEEARRILRDALAIEDDRIGLGSRLHARILDFTGGVEFELPPRSVPRLPPDFGSDGR